MNKDYKETKKFLKEYAEINLKKSRGGFYCCPACGSGKSGRAGSDGALSIAQTGEFWKCFSCNKGGDLIDLIQITEDVDILKAREKAFSFIGESCKEGKYKTTYKKEKENMIAVAKELSPPIQKADFKEFIEECVLNIENTDYPQKRGLTEEIIRKFKLGFYDGTGKAKEVIFHLLGKDILAPSLIVPYNTAGTYFIARSVLETDAERAMMSEKGIGAFNAYGRMKHYKPPANIAGSEPIYNPAALYNAEGKPVFITEAPIDCLSYQVIGKEAIAIGGTGHDKLIKQLEKRPTKNPLIIALDNDEAGRNAAENLNKKLVDMGYKTYIMDYEKPKEKII